MNIELAYLNLFYLNWIFQHKQVERAGEVHLPISIAIAIAIVYIVFLQSYIFPSRIAVELSVHVSQLNSAQLSRYRCRNRCTYSIDI